PGSPEILISGSGAFGLEGSRSVLMPPGVPSGLVLVGRAPVEALLDPPGVVPSVGVAEQRALRLRRESGCGSMDQFDLEGRSHESHRITFRSLCVAVSGSAPCI